MRIEGFLKSQLDSIEFSSRIDVVPSNGRQTVRIKDFQAFFLLDSSNWELYDGQGDLGRLHIEAESIVQSRDIHDLLRNFENFILMIWKFGDLVGKFSQEGLDAGYQGRLRDFELQNVKNLSLSSDDLVYWYFALGQLFADQLDSKWLRIE